MTTQQPEPEPIAWATLGEDGGVSMLFPAREEAAIYCDGEQPTPLYTAPPQPREPVRLDDAARYQWLRDSSHWPAVFAASDAPEPLRGSELDAAIDAALAANGVGAQE